MPRSCVNINSLSISQSTFALSFIIGPALASPLYFAVGPIVASIFNSVSFLVSALSLRAIETATFGMSLISIGLAGYFGQFIPVNNIFTVSGIIIALSGLFG